MHTPKLIGEGGVATLNRRAFAIVFSLVTATLALVAAASVSPRPASDEPLLVDPPVVTARLFYHGQPVRVSGTIPAGHEAAVVISDEGQSHVALKIKGRIWGVLWANVGEMTLDSVPSLYLAATSTDLSNLGDAALLEGMTLGYDALQSRSQISPVGAAAEDRRFFMEFIKLKEREKLYAIDEGGVSLQPDGAGGLRFSGDFFFPPDVPPDRFDVRLLIFAEGGGKLLASSDLVVTQAGLAAGISTLARERGLLYGLFSVMVALAAGLITGFVFDLGSKGGH